MARSSRRETERLLREVRRYRGLLEGAVYHLGEIGSDLQAEYASADDDDETIIDVAQEVDELASRFDGQCDSEALDKALVAYRKANPLKQAKKKARRRRAA